ncbi:MAG: hypothetical protein R2862_09355 [Thermoanaerobaculia bacterium]
MTSRRRARSTTKESDRDIIVEVNGQAVPDSASFEKAVHAAPSGSFLRLYMKRVAPRSQGGRQVNFFAVVRVP